MALTKIVIETEIVGGEQSVNQLEDIKQQAEGGVKSLTDLKKEFKALQDQLSGLTPGTQEYVDALKRLGAVKDDIGDLRSEIEGFAGADKKIAAVTNVVGGLAGGFQAAQGAAALFGADNEALNETMVKLQATMAITQGIQGLAGMGDSLKVVGNLLKSTTIGTQIATAAQKVYNAVMAANPIGLIIAGLTALAGVIALVVNSMEDENEAQKQVIAARERELEVMNSQMAKFKEEADFRRQLAQAQGKSAEEILKLNKALNEQESIQLDERIKKLRQNITERTALLGSANSDELEETKKKNEEDNKTIQESLKRQREIRRNNILEQAKFDEEQRQKAEEKAKESDAKAKERAAKKLADDIANAEKWRQEQAKFIQYEIDALNNKFGEAEQIIAEQQLATKIQLGTATPDEIEAWNAYKLKQQQDYNNAVDAELKRLSDLQNKKREEENEKIKKEYDLRLEGFKQLELQKVEWTKQGLNLISDLNELFAGQSIEQQKKAFEIDKAVKLASATISGIEGVQNAYKSAAGSPITSVFPAYPFVQAGIAGAFAAVNIAKIAKTKFNSGAGSVSAGSTGGGNLGSFSQGGGAQPPQGLTAQNTVTQLNPDGTIAGQSNQQPVKAYVVESESRAVTERVNKLSNNSKIG